MLLTCVLHVVASQVDWLVQVICKPDRGIDIVRWCLAKLDWGSLLGEALAGLARNP